MTQPITDPLADQCGNCVFWDSTGRRDGVGECTGAPPTPIMVAAKPRAVGMGMEYQLEMVRPIMAPNARPCAVHKRTLVRLIGPSSPVGGH